MGVEKRGWETGYLMGQEPRETGNKFHNIGQFFATEKAHRSRRKKTKEGDGNWANKVWEAGNADLPAPCIKMNINIY